MLEKFLLFCLIVVVAYAIYMLHKQAKEYRAMLKEFKDEDV